MPKSRIAEPATATLACNDKLFQLNRVINFPERNEGSELVRVVMDKLASEQAACRDKTMANTVGHIQNSGRFRLSQRVFL
jgi:chromosome condensin MukBEF MukE localization factor